MGQAGAQKSIALSIGLGPVITQSSTEHQRLGVGVERFAMLRHGEGATLMRATIGFFLGWLVKVGFTVAVLVVALRSQKVEAVPMLIGYFATFAGYFFGAVRASGQAEKQEMGRSG